MPYTVQQQKRDVAIVDATISALGARSIGEKQQLCESYLQDYIRISRFWAEKRANNPRKQADTLRLFLNMAQAPKIDAFHLGEYEALLKETRRLIQSKIFRRKKKADTCESPESHRQVCFCANMHAGVLSFKAENS
jgi:hypothetical protein